MRRHQGASLVDIAEHGDPGAEAVQRVANLQRELQFLLREWERMDKRKRESDRATTAQPHVPDAVSPRGILGYGIISEAERVEVEAAADANPVSQPVDDVDLRIVRDANAVSVVAETRVTADRAVEDERLRVVAEASDDAVAAADAGRLWAVVDGDPATVPSAAPSSAAAAAARIARPRGNVTDAAADVMASYSAEAAGRVQDHLSVDHLAADAFDDGRTFEVGAGSRLRR